VVTEVEPPTSGQLQRGGGVPPAVPDAVNAVFQPLSYPPKTLCRAHLITEVEPVVNFSEAEVYPPAISGAVTVS